MFSNAKLIIAIGVSSISTALLTSLAIALQRKKEKDEKLRYIIDTENDAIYNKSESTSADVNEPKDAMSECEGCSIVCCSRHPANSFGFGSMSEEADTDAFGFGSMSEEADTDAFDDLEEDYEPEEDCYTSEDDETEDADNEHDI